jgi:hypothetical protein
MLYITDTSIIKTVLKALNQNISHLNDEDIEAIMNYYSHNDERLSHYTFEDWHHYESLEEACYFVANSDGYMDSVHYQELNDKQKKTVCANIIESLDYVYLNVGDHVLVKWINDIEE